MVLTLKSNFKGSIVTSQTSNLKHVILKFYQNATVASNTICVLKNSEGSIVFRMICQKHYHGTVNMKGIHFKFVDTHNS